LQGEAVALADRRVVIHGRGRFCAKSNDFSVIWTHLSLSFCSNARQPNALRWCGIRRRPQFRDQPQDVAFQMAEVAIPKNLFADILRMIAELRPPPVASTA